MASSPAMRLRRIVGGVAVELAFRRYLTQQDIPFDNQGATPFTDPDRYDVAIGGRQCDIKSFMITKKERIREIREKPHLLEDAEALVPSDQIASSKLRDDDLYIFAFLTALVTPNQRILENAIKADQPVFMIHPLPKDWAKPNTWASLGKPTIKSGNSNRIKVELGGQNKAHDHQTEQLMLNPGKRVTTQKEFFSLNYIYTPDVPDGPIGLHCPALEDIHVIDPLDWGNIWVYGMECTFVGYMTRKDFRQKARQIAAGSRVFQYPRTSTDNLGLPIKDLYPLKGLLSQAKSWSNSNS